MTAFTRPQVLSMTTLSIALAPAKYASHYTPGERLSGQVTLFSDSEVELTSLKMSLGYEVLGRTSDEEIVDTEMLTTQQVFEGEHTFGFEFELPFSLCSYDGEHIQIRWFVLAQLQGAQRHLIEDRVEFALYGGAGDDSSRPDEEWPPLDVAGNDYGMGCIVPTALVCCGLLAWGALPLIQGLGFEEMIESVLDSPGWYIFGGIVFAFVALVLAVMLHRWLASKMLESVSIDIQPWPLRVGGSHLYVMDMMPSRDLNLNSASVRLTCTATLSFEDNEGDSSSTSHVVFEQAYELSSQVSLKKGTRVRWTTLIELPTTVPMSFESLNTRVEWELETTLDIPNWPDWEDTHGVEVCAQLGESVKRMGEEPGPEPVPW